MLCSRQIDLEVFDAAFVECFGEPVPEDPPHDRAAGGHGAGPPGPAPHPAGAARGTGRTARRGRPDPDPRPVAWSDIELLRHKDFADYTDAERELRAPADRAAGRPRAAPPVAAHPARPPPRTRAPRARATTCAARCARRCATAASPSSGAGASAPTARARLVLVCDVSGSMEAYARMLVQYLQAAVAASRRVEAFAFGTRLTRITHELRGKDPDAAVARASDAVADWSGGTRIGDSLSTLNRDYARNVGRGAVVVVLSDGWDRGDPILLQMEMQRLARCAHSLVWLNPLKAQPGLRAAHARHAGGAAARGPLPGRQLDRVARGAGRPARRRTRMSDLDVLEDVDGWVAGGQSVALATVVNVKRSAPRPPGAKMAVSSAGFVSGAVSGGCVEGAVVEVAEEVIKSGTPRLLHFGIADSEAWDVGLPCGGEIDVWVERYEP